MPTDNARKSEHAWVVGTVIALNCDRRPPAVKVKLDNNQLTDWIPWAQPRAGKSYLWFPPQVGEQGIVLSAGGEMEVMFFIAGLFTDAYLPKSPPPKPELFDLRFANGDFIRHNSKTGELRIKATGNCYIDAKNIHLNEGS